MAQEFWLISTPGEKNQTQNNVAWEKMNHATSIQSQLSTNTKFSIPDLKVGTLDQLVGLSDDLAKQDTFVESVTRKMANYLGEVLEDQRDKLGDHLLAGQKRLPAYLQSFAWEAAKFPTKQSLRGIVDAIGNQVTQIEQDLKSKSSNYNNLKTTLANMERKQTGSILTRALGEIVKKEHFVHNSEYLVTLLVVVPKLYYQEWQAKYENLTDMVVPRSSKMIYEDNDHGLFTVTVFLKVVDEFKLHARENKFLVRDFTYNEEELAAGKNELTKLISDKKKHFGPLVRWIKVNFSECFLCYTHVKAIRVFVESVLRYGLPVNFQPALLQVSKKNVKRMRDILNNLYSHLDSTAASGTGHTTDVDIPGLGFNTGEYFPYVFFKINVEFTDHRI